MSDPTSAAASDYQRFLDVAHAASLDADGDFSVSGEAQFFHQVFLELLNPLGREPALAEEVLHAAAVRVARENGVDLDGRLTDGVAA